MAAEELVQQSNYVSKCSQTLDFFCNKFIKKEEKDIQWVDSDLSGKNHCTEIWRDIW